MLDTAEPLTGRVAGLTSSAATVRSPMPGTVVAVKVAQGDVPATAVQPPRVGRFFCPNGAGAGLPATVLARGGNRSRR